MSAGGALPYYDGDIPEELLKRVEALIQEEMKKGEGAEEAAPLEDDERLATSSAILEGEMARIGEGTVMDKVEMRHGGSVRPPGDGASSQDWQAAVLNARVHVMHEEGRLGNLQLLQKYGEPAWKGTFFSSCIFCDSA